MYTEKRNSEISDQEKLRAGVVGLGMIGGGIAESLLTSGYLPAVYDVRRESMEPFAGRARLASSAKEVAALSEVVMICVVNAAQAESVLTGGDGVLSAGKRGLIVCLVSTVSRRDVLRLGALCEEAGASLIDCGVSPGYLAARNGMIAMAGGGDEALERAESVLSGWSKEVIRCGGAGAGMAVKLARNVFTFGCWRVAKEAQHLVEASGGDPHKLLRAIEASDPEGELPLDKLRRAGKDGKIPPEVAEKNYPLMVKDLDAALDLAEETDVSMPAALAAREFAEDTLDFPRPEEDASARGIAAADRVYRGMGAHLASRAENAYVGETLKNVFGGVWSRGGLSLSSRRLLVMGVAAAQGRADLIRMQALGALQNGELTESALQEAVLQLSYYAGWCNGGAVARGVSEAIAAFHRERGLNDPAQK